MRVYFDSKRGDGAGSACGPARPLVPARWLLDALSVMRLGALNHGFTADVHHAPRLGRAASHRIAPRRIDPERTIGQTLRSSRGVDVQPSNDR
jgi:hypothetical protein